jgi:hypothetical protein
VLAKPKSQASKAMKPPQTEPDLLQLDVKAKEVKVNKKSKAEDDAWDLLNN